MTSRLNPYINFNGTAREAMEFYTSVFGGELLLTTFKEGGAPVGADEENKVMHASLSSDKGIFFMASDTPSHMEHVSGKNISMSLSGEDAEELSGYWEKLSAGATVEQPLVKAPWGDTFGMLTDKFGIRWMVNITVPKK